MATTEEKDKITKQLQSVFGNSRDGIESLLRVSFYLTEEETAYRGSDISPAWRMLRASSYNDHIFKGYAQRLADDTKKAEKDVKFRRKMNQMYTDMIQPTTVANTKESTKLQDHLSDIAIRNADSGLIGLAHAWPQIPVASQKLIIDFIRNYGGRSVLPVVDDCVSLVNKHGGNVVMVGLAAVYLTYEAIRNIGRWWKGEISGKRCAKNLIDSFSSVAGGIGGGMSGAAIGGLAGPIGLVIGGVAGSIIGSNTAQWLSDKLTQYLFDVPKSVALENAYNFFRVSKSASNHEINKAFHELCLKHHPDKGGKSEQFHLVQINMAVIKEARGEN